MSFGFKRSLTVTGAQVPASQSDFPALVVISDATFKTFANGGRIRNSSGFDIYFYSDSLLTSKLDHEIESYDGTSGVFTAWVRIPTLTTSSVIYVGYGDVGITVSGENKPGVWDTNFKGIWHLPNGSSLSAADSKGTNNGTLNNTPTAATGKVDGGVNLASASSQSISLGTDASLNPSAITVSAWVKGTSFPNGYNAVFAKVSFGATAFHEILIKSTGKLAVFVRGNSTLSFDGTGSNTLSTGTFYYLTLVYSSSVGIICYVNASVDASVAADGVLASNSGNSTIGNDTNTAGRFFNGVIDEVRVSNIVRSANWITTEYNNMLNQTGGGAFWTLGTEVSIGVTATGIVYPSSYIYEVILSGSTWTDITQYVVQEQTDTTIGINGNGPLDMIAGPGSAKFRLRNDNPIGLFSPGHASCMAGWTYGIPFRMSVVYLGSPFIRFRGRIRSIAPDTGAKSRRQVSVVAYDVMKDLAQADLREVAIQVNKTESETVSAILDAVPTDMQPVSRDIDTGVDTLAYALYDIGTSPKALSVLADVARSSFMLLACKSDGTFIARSRQTRADPASLFTFSGDFLRIDIPSDLESVYNLVRITTHPLTIDAAPTTVLYSLVGEAPVLSPLEIKTLWGKYSDALNAQRLIGGLNQVVPIVAGTDYSGNSALAGGGTDYTANLTITTTAFAAEAKFVVQNTSSQTVYLVTSGGVTRLQIRGKAVRDLGPQTFQSPSTTPSGLVRPLDIDQRYQSNGNVAQALAGYIYSLYSTLNRQMKSLTFMANENNAKMLLALTVEPGDEVTVTEPVSGVTAAGAVVQSVSLMIKEKVITCTLGLAPANTFVFWEWGIVGRAEWGQTTIYGV